MTLRWRPSAARSATSGAGAYAVRVVTGILTQTLSPHDAMRCACPASR